MPVHDTDYEHAIMLVNAAFRTVSHSCVGVTVPSTQS